MVGALPSQDPSPAKAAAQRPTRAALGGSAFAQKSVRQSPAQSGARSLQTNGCFAEGEA